MAVLSFAADPRIEGTTVDGKRSVETLVAGKGVAADTINPVTLGFNEIDEIWQKVSLGGTSKAPSISAALTGIFRIVGK